jgi:hypothetical protein
MPLVEQKLHTIPEHLQFLMGLVVQDLLVFGWILSIIDCGFGPFICLAFE